MAVEDVPVTVGVGQCERCHERNVQRYRYHVEVPAPHWSHAKREGYTTLILTETLCEKCLKAAIDNDHTAGID